MTYHFSLSGKIQEVKVLNLGKGMVKRALSFTANLLLWFTIPYFLSIFPANDFLYIIESEKPNILCVVSQAEI